MLERVEVRLEVGDVLSGEDIASHDGRSHYDVVDEDEEENQAEDDQRHGATREIAGDSSQLHCRKPHGTGGKAW